MFAPKQLVFRGLMDCTRCDLCKYRHRVVPGNGNPAAKILLVGQQPGPDENISGRPFTGASGQLLRDWMKTAGLQLDFHTYYTNVNKCTTLGGKKPTPGQMNACLPFLMQEIKLVNPNVIVAMGDNAYKLLLPGESKKITQIRGNVYEREIAGAVRLVIPTTHPAWVARNPKAYGRDFIADLRKVKEIAQNGYRAINTFRTTRARDWQEVLDTIHKSDTIGLDFETTALIDITTTKIIGIGVCASRGEGIYYPFESDQEATAKIQSLRWFFEGDKRKIISNAKFEMEMLANYGVGLNNWDDTMIEAWILGDYPRSLKDGLHRVDGTEMLRIDRFYKMGYQTIDYHTGKRIVDLAAAQNAVPDAVAEYAAQDPDASQRLHQHLYPILVQRKLVDLYENIELPFTRILCDIERTGFLFDPSRLAAFQANLTDAERIVHERLVSLAGREINVQSTKQIIELLYYDTSHGYTLALFDGDNPTPTDKTSLAIHASNPLVRAILSERAVRKMRNTYLEALPRWTLPDGRIYALFLQTQVETGRLSSARPNLTNIPSRQREDIDFPLDGSLIRRAFIARPGWLIGAADLSQIEKRISAHVSGDPGMISELTPIDGDIHSRTCTGLYGITKEQTTERDWKNKRDTAKMIGFGIDYGLGEHGLRIRTPHLGLTKEQAQALIDAYYSTFPAVYQWQLATKQFAFKNGYAETILGRRRYLPDITSYSPSARSEAARAAINHPIQGSAADYFKKATLDVYDFIKRSNLRTKIVALVHDEIVMEIPAEELEIIEREVPPLMAEAIKLKVPVYVDFEFGPSWGEVKERSKWEQQEGGLSWLG